MNDPTNRQAGLAWIRLRAGDALERLAALQEEPPMIFTLMAAKGEDFALPVSLLDRASTCRVDFDWQPGEVRLSLYPEGYSRIRRLAGRQALLRSLNNDAIRYAFQFDAAGEATIPLDRTPAVESGLRNFRVVVIPDNTP